eukprot:m.479000 g.479000  ORF g.479000 m.479000 type:complete len:86 (+) comp21696_c1_seq6:1599-1856(+)
MHLFSSLWYNRLSNVTENESENTPLNMKIYMQLLECDDNPHTPPTLSMRVRHSKKDLIFSRTATTTTAINATVSSAIVWINLWQC